ncbi:cytochrome P450 1A1-like [Ptychodera flava]|uniref:cytochrome P450 1A1-like n=1 Tax=Ptychodera flava TaxID=63121 RepID=UPI00396A65CC
MYWFLVILTLLIGASLLKLEWGKGGVTLVRMPGPRGWPVIGSLLSIGKRPHETFSQLAKTYGNVFKVRLGSRTIVVMHGMKAVRDALLKQAVTFAGRPNFFSMQRLSFNGFNFFTESHSKRWIEQRKMIDSALKIFVDDRPKVLQEKIITEGNELVRILTKDGKGNILDPHDDLHLSVRNILSIVLYIQEKAQQEIDAVIGRERPPAFTDRQSLPYVDSLIHELLRHATLAPLSVPHATVNDTKFYGYDIPNDTPVFPNLHSANFDVTEWEDPDQFKPERFLSQDGQSLNKVKTAKLASFSFGKRRYPGEQLAQKELFLFITLFLQRCNINKCPGDDPKLKWNHGLSLSPDRFNILTTPRNPLSDKA